MFKSNKGFTLVELIVVIAILAILAGVAIPVYNGYIKRAQDAAVVTELDAIQTAAQAANATCGQIEYIVVDENSISVGGAGQKLAKGFNSDFGLFYPDAASYTNGDLGVFGVGIELQGSYTDGATWQNGEWTKGADSSIIVGQEEGGIGGGDTVTDDDVPPGVTLCGHKNYKEEITKQASCKEAGVKTFTCQTADCGHTYTVEIAKTNDHNFVDGKCTVCEIGENDMGLS